LSTNSTNEQSTSYSWREQYESAFACQLAMRQGVGVGLSGVCAHHADTHGSSLKQRRNARTAGIYTKHRFERSGAGITTSWRQVGHDSVKLWRRGRNAK
jgi:hypothetical protein